MFGLWLACLAGVPVWGQSSLILSSASATAGSTVSLSLSLAAPAADTAALEWTLAYPSQNLAGISATAGAALTAAGKSLTCGASAGRYTCIAAGLNDQPIGAGVVAAVSVTLASSAGNTTISVSNTLGASRSGSSLSLTGLAGVISTAVATAPVVSGVACSPASVTGPASSACTVTLSAAAPGGGAAVSLTSSHALVTVPSQITISAGAAKATFTATAAAAAADQIVTIKAAYNGSSRSATLTVLRPPAVSNLNCSPTVLLPAATSTCTVALTKAAPAGGAALAVSSSSALLTAPSSVSVAAGASSAKFAVTAGAITASSAATVTAVLSGSGPMPASASLTLSPAFTPIRINAGGKAYTDARGVLWAADNSFTGGNPWATASAIAKTDIPVVYQSGRYGSSFSYQFAVPNGDYTAILKFAEISQTAAGKRMFNVGINGTAVLANFDIFAQAGSPYIALNKAFPVKVRGGKIVIQFSTGAANSPLVNGIEIVGSSGVSVSVSPPQWSLAPGQSKQFTATVTGAANTGVVWTRSPAIGDISSSGVYTAPSSISELTSVVVTARSVVDLTRLASATVALWPATAVSFTPIRVNAGGPAYTDAHGTLWSADSGYSGGTPWSTTKPIGNTPVPLLYQTVRYGGSFSYQFTVPNGTYSVRLKFAEVSLSAAGQRVFNVAINGSAVLSNFDVIAEAGAPLTALDQVFPVSVTGGQIRINFSSGTANSPLISAIEIVQATAFTPIRVNAGGKAYTDAQGATWSSDTGYSGGTSWQTLQNISNTSDPSLYRVVRYGVSFAYEFPVPNGTYRVKLKFAEVSQTLPGQRVFNVTLNGQPVLVNFDVIAAAGGPLKAIDKVFPVSVTGGRIRIDFSCGPANSPLINAIEIAP